jgi:hypothetical protein
MKKEQLFMARQGDVLLRQIRSIPTNAKKAKSKVVAVGEGHHEHKAIGDLYVLELENNLYLAVNSKGQLVHVHTGTETLAEHLPIELKNGFYEVIHQQQYNPYEKDIERVRD